MTRRKSEKKEEPFDVEEALNGLGRSERMLLETSYERCKEEGESFEEYVKGYCTSSSSSIF